MSGKRTARPLSLTVLPPPCFEVQPLISRKEDSENKTMPLERGVEQGMNAEERVKQVNEYRAGAPVNSPVTVQTPRSPPLTDTAPGRQSHQHQPLPALHLQLPH